MILRGFFALIDLMVRWIMVQIIDLVFRISEVNIIKDTAIEEFTVRIYGILGIIILFKIVISAVQYLVSPDKLLDKDKGIGGLLQRTVISVALLALVPVIFDFAGEVQKYVSNAIPQIILGQNVTIGGNDGTSDTHLIAERIASMTLKVFITDSEGNPVDLGESYVEQLRNEKLTSGCDWVIGVGCDYDYNYLLSLLVAGFIAYIFLSMGIDIGIRAIKMGILEILAPIPISSYINSEENFKAWYQMAFKVYADLFVRLILIYFIVYIVDLVLGGGIDINGQDRGFWHEPFLSIYIIVALFVFAKSAPKFICEALGIKSDGFGDMAEMFKPAWQRGGVLAAPVAGIAAGIGSARARSGWGGKWYQSVGSGLKSAVSGTARGLYGAVKGDKYSDVLKNSRDGARAAADKRFEFAARSGNTWAARTSTRMREAFDRFTGIPTGAEQINKNREFYETLKSLKTNEKKNALAKVNALNGFVDNTLTENGTSVITLKNGNSYPSYARFVAELNGLQNTPYDSLTDTQKDRLEVLMNDKDFVEKFMIRNQSYIALTNHKMDQGNYSAIAADITKIVRSGTPEQVEDFLKKIGNGVKAQGEEILRKLEGREDLRPDEAKWLNNYIAGDLEDDAETGISEARAHERTVPKGQS